MLERHESEKTTQPCGIRPMSCVATSFIAERYRPLRNAAKILGRLTGASPRTTERWLRGEAEPSFPAVMELARNDHEFRARLISFLENAS